MIGGSKHVFICVECESFTYLKSQDSIAQEVREHRRKHLANLQGYAETITVLYDGRDETTPYLSALVKWRTEHQHTEPVEGKNG